jgi:hypothetical protein
LIASSFLQIKQFALPFLEKKFEEKKLFRFLGIVFHFCKKDLKELDKLSTEEAERKSQL